MATAANASSYNIPFAIFSAANEAAILLFELIQAHVSPPNLINRGNTIGYQLSLPLTSHDAEPDDSSMKWLVGAGPSPALLEKGVRYINPDILLCTPGATPASRAVRSHIKDIHGVIEFHRLSGVLRFRTFCSRSVIYERGDIHDNDLELNLDKWGKGETCVLRREKNYLRFGPYHFYLQFMAQTEESYGMLTDYLNEHITNNCHGLNPSCLFNFIPKPSPYLRIWRNIWLHNEIPTTHIITGVNIYTGHPIAIKKIHNTEVVRTRRQVIDQLRTALHYKDTQDGGILGVFDIWCSHQTSPPCLFNINRHKTLDRCQNTFYSMPLAEYNFLDLPWSKVAYEVRLSYIHQTLLGLADLHEQGIVHGNIRPESLLILASIKHTLYTDTKIPTAKKAVLSFSTSQRTKTTIDLDETKLDIWALAASWLHAFIRIPSHFKVATKHDHCLLQGQISTKIKEYPSRQPFLALLYQMLAWEPHHRLSVAEVLASDAWQCIQVERQKSETKKRKQKDLMQSARVKRVRVLSPDVEDCRVIEP
ncbi:kinase-like domain-containing protein [Trichoderma ceciliae]